MAATAKPTQKNTPRIPTSYQSAVPITPADDTQIGPFIGVYVGGAGDVAVVMRNEDASTVRVFKAVPVGTILPISIQGVQLTLTTATNLMGLG
jgi:hypothetical protein